MDILTDEATLGSEQEEHLTGRLQDCGSEPVWWLALEAGRQPGPLALVTGRQPGPLALVCWMAVRGGHWAAGEVRQLGLVLVARTIMAMSLSPWVPENRAW